MYLTKLFKETQAMETSYILCYHLFPQQTDHLNPLGPSTHKSSLLIHPDVSRVNCQKIVFSPIGHILPGQNHLTTINKTLRAPPGVHPKRQYKQAKM